MSDTLGSRLPQGFQDLVPWADPYIVALIEKLRRDQAEEAGLIDVVGELPPPLDNDDDANWQSDWSRRD